MTRLRCFLFGHLYAARGCLRCGHRAMSTLLDHAGPIRFGLAMWWYALSHRCPKAWRFA